MANLDHCIPRLMPLVMSRGGAAKYKIQKMTELLKVPDMVFTIGETKLTAEKKKKSIYLTVFL